MVVPSGAVRTPLAVLVDVLIEAGECPRQGAVEALHWNGEDVLFRWATGCNYPDQVVRGSRVSRRPGMRVSTDDGPMLIPWITPPVRPPATGTGS